MPAAGLSGSLGLPHPCAVRERSQRLLTANPNRTGHQPSDVSAQIGAPPMFTLRPPLPPLPPVNVRTLAGPGAAPGNVGGYFPCTPSGVPHNEIFNKDSRGRLVSQMNGAWARQCVTVPGPTPPTPPYTGLSVWPIPREEAANGPTLDLAHSFAIEYGGESAVAAAAVARYTALLANKTAKTLSHSPSHTLYLSARKNGSPSSSTSPSSPGLPKLSLVLLSADDTLTNWTVNESYTLEVKGGAAVATCVQLRHHFGLFQNRVSRSQLYRA